MKFFVYGTLKEGYSNHHILRKATKIGEGVTVSDTYLMYDGGFPYVVPNAGSYKIVGEVYEVEDDYTKASLDRLEGVPDHFRHHSADILLEDGNIVDATMYVASPRTIEYLSEGKYRTPIVPNDNNECIWGK